MSSDDSLQAGKKLQDEVLCFDPRAKGLPVDNVNILLCGGVGSGKSSFVSTVDSLCEGHISRIAPHGQGTGSLTCKLRKYSFNRPDTRQKVHWKLWDTMGWSASDFRQGELGYILDGELPDRCRLDQSNLARTPGLNSGVQDRVHCICLVVPCDSATDEAYMLWFREMVQFARNRGKPSRKHVVEISSVYMSAYKTSASAVKLLASACFCWSCV